jgi:hypothetical protein
MKPYHRFKRFIFDFWNILDLLTYTSFVSAVVIRCLVSTDYFHVARVMYTITVLFSFFRLLHVFLVHQSMGPLVLMIKEMVSQYCQTLLLVSVSNARPPRHCINVQLSTVVHQTSLIRNPYLLGRVG